MDFYGQYNTDKILYEKIFIHKPLKGTGLAIEAGAADGVYIANTKFFEDTLGWKTINVEPNPDKFIELTQNRPNSININHAISNEPNQNLFLNHTPNRFLHGKITTNPKDTPVTTTTYSNIIKDYNITEVNLFSLDVEGYEIKVLADMVTCNVLPDVLCIEHNSVGRRNIVKILPPDMYEPPIKININSAFVKKGFLPK